MRSTPTTSGSSGLRTVVRLGSPHSVSRFVYFVTLILSNTVDFGARQTNQS